MALQALYQLDARGGADADEVREGLIAGDDTARTREAAVEAMALAQGAFERRAEADADLRLLAPTWPADRQPAIDRAIIRLAHYEMSAGGVNPKVAVNEAIELAKEFSTDRSPAFINGVLDKVLKRVLGGAPAGAPPEAAAPGA